MTKIVNSIILSADLNRREGRVFQAKVYTNRQRAIDFVWMYIPSFCVYCSYTGQLYTNYDLYNLENTSGVIVLPKNHHDTFNFSGENSVFKTKFVMATSSNLKKTKLLDLRQPGNIKSLQTNLFNLALEKRLLPVVLKSDLRRLKNDLPYLSIHTLDLANLPSMSDFRLSQIEAAVLDRLESSPLSR
ncbi:MAG: hypothetical protein ACJAUP_000212 [Cellvibrionaceae bacterium]|jgi:hypothetical protein